MIHGAGGIRKSLRDTALDTDIATMLAKRLGQRQRQSQLSSLFSLPAVLSSWFPLTFRSPCDTPNQYRTGIIVNARPGSQ